MIRSGLSALFISTLLAISLSGVALAAEEILQWRSDITIHEDASMTVTETIKVRAKGRLIKRGIYRDFPTTYRDRAGNRVTVDFELLGLNRDGQPEPYHTERRDNGIRIYAGQKDIFLSPGEYIYTITYNTDRQLGFFEDHDELYWNVTGNGWEFPIRAAQAVVTVPPSIEPSALRAEGYTGPVGSVERALTSRVDFKGKVYFDTTRPLGPREGFTIVVGWPKGFVAEPGQARRTQYFVSDNTGLILALAGFMLLMSYYLWAWHRVGRDPERGVVIPRFTPPEKLSPAALRYLREMGADNKAFTAAVIDLAVKGYLVIREEKGFLGFGRSYRLERLDTPLKEPLSVGEYKVARKLFPGDRKIIKIGQENHKKLSGASEVLKKYLKAEFQEAHFKNNHWWLVPGLVLSLVTLIAAGTADASQIAPFLMLTVWLTGWTAGTIQLWMSKRRFMAFAFLFFWAGAMVFYVQITSFAMALLLPALVGSNALFYHLLRAPTRLGRRIMDAVEGFRMYLSTAEEHRLEKLHPPEKTPELFERYLPYALALEVDQEWSEKFAGVLYRAAASKGYSPVWYHGSDWNSTHTGRFASDLGSSLSSAISSASSAPGSSSGFGGGSSGGGGGGGGGGGW